MEVILRWNEVSSQARIWSGWLQNYPSLCQNTKGKVYSYLPPVAKALVDAIVDELAKDERVAAA